MWTLNLGYPWSCRSEMDYAGNIRCLMGWLHHLIKLKIRESDRKSVIYLKKSTWMSGRDDVNMKPWVSLILPIWNGLCGEYSMFHGMITSFEQAENSREWQEILNLSNYVLECFRTLLYINRRFGMRQRCSMCMDINFVFFTRTLDSVDMFLDPCEQPTCWACGMRLPGNSDVIHLCLGKQGACP
jgi:hypothetical protein